MLFYTRCHYVAKGKITVHETDTNSMKLEKWLLFLNWSGSIINTSMTATAILVLFVTVVLLESEPNQMRSQSIDKCICWENK